MSTVKILKLDLLGTNSDNVVSNTVDVSDTSIQFLRPDNTPFYSTTLVVTDAKGQILKEGDALDYTLIDLVTGLVEKTGKSVHSFIRINNPDLHTRGPLKLTYHSIGINHPPRSTWGITDVGAGSKNPIDWETQVLGKPDTFPSKPHWQDFKTETSGWDDLIKLIDTLYVYRNGRTQAMYNELLALSDNAWINVVAATADMRKIVENHTLNYTNLHGLTKTDINRGNLENYPTGTAREQLTGKAQTLVTAAGATALAKDVGGINNTLYAAGNFPFSFYGPDGFLAPNVITNPSGLGFGEVNGIYCKETSDSTLGLLSRYNGNDGGLYYYRLTDKGMYPLNQKYVHPVINTTNNDAAYGVVAGSNENLAGLYNKKKTTVYLAVMNKTFDPTAHVVCKINLSTLTIDATSLGLAPGESWLNRLSVHSTKTKVLLFIKIKGSDGGFSSVAVYSALLANITSNASLSFSLQTTLALDAKDAPTGTSTNGKINFTPSVDLVYNSKVEFLSCVAPDSPEKLILQMVYRINTVVGQIGRQFTYGVRYSYDSTLKVLTKLDIGANPSFNYRAPVTPTQNAAVYDVIANGYSGVGVSVMDDGRLVVMNQNLGGYNYITQWGRTKYETVANIPVLGRFPSLTVAFKDVDQPLSLNDFSAPKARSYDVDGEMFYARVKGASVLMFTAVTGLYTQNAAISNENYATLYTRPIGQPRYTVSTGSVLPARVTLTSESVADSTAKIGSTYWGVCRYTSGGVVPYNGTLIDDVVLPNQYNKTIVDDKVVLTSTGVNVTWPGEIIRRAINWITRQASVKSIAIEMFITPTVPSLEGEPVTQATVFVNCLFDDGSSTVQHSYGVCAATIGADLNTTDPTKSSYRVIGLSLNNSIYLDTLTVNSTNDTLTVMDANGKVSPLGIGSIYNVPDPSNGNDLLAVNYYGTPLSLTLGNGTKASLLINGFNTSGEVKAGISSVQTISTSPLLTTSGLIDFKLTSTELGGSLLNVMRTADQKTLKLYLRSTLNFVDSLTGLKNQVFLRHNITVAKGPGEGINGELERTTYTTELESLSERVGVPGIGEVLLTGGLTAMGLTGQVGAAPGVPTRGVLLSSMYLTNQWSLYFVDSAPVVFNGKSFTLDATVIDLSVLIPNPANTTFYIYVINDGGKAKYLINTNKFASNNSLLYVGYVITGTNGITTYSMLKPFMVADKVLSSLTPRGGAIPATQGLPTETTYLNWY